MIANSQIYAIVLVTLGCTTLAGNDALGKYLMQSFDFSAVQLVWARYTFHALTVAVVFWLQGQRHFLHSNVIGIQLLRGLCMLAVSLALYFSMLSISLAEATAIMYLSPVFIILLAGLFLGEKVLARHFLAAALGFIGVLLIIRPGFEGFEPAMLLALISAIALATYFLLTRKITGIDTPETSLFYAAIVAAAVLSLILPWWWVAPTQAWQWLALVGMGVGGAVGHFLFIKAANLIPASALSPWLNAQVVAATMFSVFVLNDVLHWTFYIGTALVIVAGVVVHQRR